MQRELEFRVWDKDEKCFFESESHEFVLTVKNKIHYLDHGNNYIFTQYTGLLDFTGKEIYEGDIVTVSENYRYFNPESKIKYEVCWDHTCFYPFCKNWADEHSDAHATEFKIIGNIFENPDLLENKE